MKGVMPRDRNIDEVARVFLTFDRADENIGQSKKANC
jgi:hypothetical protein